MPLTLVEQARVVLLEAILANKTNLARNEVASSVKLLSESYVLLGEASLLTTSTPEVPNAPVT